MFPFKKKVLFTLSITLILLAVLSAPIFADGEEPAVETPAAEETPPAESADTDAEESAPPEESVPADETPELVSNAEEAPLEAAQDEPTEEKPAAQPTAEEPAAAETQDESAEPAQVAQELAESGLELATPDGETLDLASEETAEMLAAPDPYFKVGTTTYNFTAADCDPDLAGAQPCGNPIQAAIDYIAANGTIPSDRKIYVEADTYTENVTFDGSTPNISSLNGLIGVDGSGSTFLNGNISLSNLTGGFTLQGFTINGGVSASDITGTVNFKDLEVSNPSGTGIDAASNINGAVVMEKVKSSGNSGHGAFVVNTDAGKAYNITIKTAYFDDNDDGTGDVMGLHLATLGAVTIDGVSASNNVGAGINIVSSFSALTIKNSTMTGNDRTPDEVDNGYGLLAVTDKKANVTLENIVAGDHPRNNYTAPVLGISTAGNVTIKNVRATSTFGTGLYVDNTAGTGSVKIYNSAFIDNNNGIEIASMGSVYLSSVIASDNINVGALINNCQDIAGVCTGTGTVTITSPKSLGIYGANRFSANQRGGLEIISGNTISLTNIIADDNNGYGIYLDNAQGKGNVSIKKSIPTNEYSPFMNSATDNVDVGLEILSKGSVTVEYLNADSNDIFHGAYIDNTFASSAKNVSIKNATFNENAPGLYVATMGSITLNNVSASNNKDFGSWNGAYLDTTAGTSGGVTIKCDSDTPCQFNNNSDRGLEIYAYGNISLTNVESIGNESTSVLHNHNASSTRKVSISGGNFSGTLNDTGLEVLSKGSITLKNVIADSNEYGGAHLNNTLGSAAISIRDSDFSNNANGDSLYEGLFVISNKNISLYNVNALGNQGVGALLDNCIFNSSICVGSGSVTIKSSKNTYNAFAHNGDNGLMIVTKGTVSASNMDVSNNGSEGMVIDSNLDLKSGNVTISASSKMRSYFENNGGSGLTVNTLGAVTINYADITGNGSWGAYLSNATADRAKNVKIKESTFNMNTGIGLEVNTNGSITLQGVDCSDNSQFNGTFTYGTQWIKDVLSATAGDDVWTYTSGGGASYSVNVTSEFFAPYIELRGPDGALIDFDSDSTSASISGNVGVGGDYQVIISSLYGGAGLYDFHFGGAGIPVQDQFYGAYLDNTYGTGNISIVYSSKVGYGARFWNNTYGGLKVVTTGSVSGKNVDAFGNGITGIDVFNDDDAEKPVTFSTIYADFNGENGLVVNSRGNITLSKAWTTGNAGHGAFLNNSNALRARNIKVSTASILDNFNTGSDEESLMILSTGNVSLSNITSMNPTGHYGVFVDNAYGTGSVTLSGKSNNVSNNGYGGVLIVSYGHVTITNIIANENNNTGLAIENNGGLDAKNVKIGTSGKFYNQFNGNSLGISVNSKGSITLSKSLVETSDWGGALLQTTTGADSVKVNVSNSKFNDGQGHLGLEILSTGAVTVSNIQAVGNFQEGLRILNTYGTAPANVTLKNAYISGNGANISYAGMILSDGYISISNLTSSDNASSTDGFIISNPGGGGVSITNGYFTNNSGNGLDILSNGPVKLKNINAIGNYTHGIVVDGDSSFIDVTLSTVNAVGNIQGGIRLTNVQDVTISQTNCLHNGQASYPSAPGLYIGGSGTSYVSLSKSAFMGNFGQGFTVNGISSVTLYAYTIIGNDIDNSGEGDTNLPLW